MSNVIPLVPEGQHLSACPRCGGRLQATLIEYVEDVIVAVEYQDLGELGRRPVGKIIGHEPESPGAGGPRDDDGAHDPELVGDVYCENDCDGIGEELGFSPRVGLRL